MQYLLRRLDTPAAFAPSAGPLGGARPLRGRIMRLQPGWQLALGRGGLCLALPRGASCRVIQSYVFGTHRYRRWMNSCPARRSSSRSNANGLQGYGRAFIVLLNRICRATSSCRIRLRAALLRSFSARQGGSAIGVCVLQLGNLCCAVQLPPVSASRCQPRCRRRCGACGSWSILGATAVLWAQAVHERTNVTRKIRASTSVRDSRRLPDYDDVHQTTQAAI